MLHEIKNVKQERGAGRRRWFESEGLEVVVWFTRSGTVTGFQLCYDLGDGQHALTWHPASGFAHNSIDTGDESPFSNQTPILQQGGPVPWNELAHLFDERSATLEPALRNLIHDNLAAQVAANAGG